MCTNDEDIRKHFILITFSKFIAIRVIGVTAIITIQNLQEIFIINIRGINFCQVISTRLLNHEIEFLNFKIQLFSGNIPILHIIEARITRLI